LIWRPLMPPALFTAAKYASEACPTAPATDTGPLNGTVWPSLISVSDTPGSYRCAMAGPVAKTKIARTAQSMLPSIRLSFPATDPRVRPGRRTPLSSAGLAQRRAEPRDPGADRLGLRLQRGAIDDQPAGDRRDHLGLDQSVRSQRGPRLHQVHD